MPQTSPHAASDRQRVRSADGRVFTFPAGMSQDAMRDALVRFYADQKNAGTDSKAAPKAAGEDPWADFPVVEDTPTSQATAQTSPQAGGVIEVELPDGTILEFPEGTPEETMRNVTKRFIASEQYTGPKPEPKDPRNDLGGVTRGYLATTSGFNRGLANVAGAPVDAVNWGLGKLGVPVSGKPFFGSEWLKGAGETVGAIREPDPEYGTLETIAEGTGSGVGAISGMGLLGALGKGMPIAEAIGSAVAPATRSAPAFAAQVPAEAAATTGALLGEEAGRHVGGDTGAAVGALAGGIAPASIMQVARSAPRAVLSRGGDGSAEVLGALERTGIDPSAGLVGNRPAALAENYAAYAPVAGARVHKKQVRQAEQFGDALRGVSDRLRGEPSSPALDKSTVGLRVQDMAESGLERLKNDISNREGTLSAHAAKSGSAVDPRSARREILALMDHSTPRMQQVLKGALDDLDQMRDMPIDAALHKNLQQRRAVLENSLRTARGQKAQEFRDSLKALDTEIADNMGVDFGRFRQWRTEAGTNTRQAGVPGGAWKRVYSASTRGLEDFADRAGMRDKFDALMADESRVYAREGNFDRGGDIPALQREVSRRDSLGAFNYLVEGGKAAPERLELLKRNSKPEEWNALTGDVFEIMGRARPGASTIETDFSPEMFLTNWERMSERAKALMAGGERKTLDDLATAAKAFKARGARMDARGSLVAHGLTAGTTGLAIARPGTAAALLAGAFAGGEILTNRGFARYLAQKAPTLAELLGPRIAGAAGRATGGE